MQERRDPRGKPRAQTKPAWHSSCSCIPQGVGGEGRSPAPFLPMSQHLPTLCPQIQESEHIKLENSESGSKLTILAARQEHCGCYTLLVENKLGSRQAQVNLTVVGECGWVAWKSEAGKVDSPCRTLGLPWEQPWSLPTASFPSPCSHTIAMLHAH